MHKKHISETFADMLTGMLHRQPGRSARIAKLVKGLQRDEQDLRRKLAKRLLPAQRRRLELALEVNRLQQRKGSKLLAQLGRQQTRGKRFSRMRLDGFHPT